MRMFSFNINAKSEKTASISPIKLMFTQYVMLRTLLHRHQMSLQSDCYLAKIIFTNIFIGKILKIIIYLKEA